MSWRHPLVVYNHPPIGAVIIKHTFHTQNTNRANTWTVMTNIHGSCNSMTSAVAAAAVADTCVHPSCIRTAHNTYTPWRSFLQVRSYWMNCWFFIVLTLMKSFMFHFSQSKICSRYIYVLCHFPMLKTYWVVGNLSSFVVGCCYDARNSNQNRPPLYKHTFSCIFSNYIHSTTPEMLISWRLNWENAHITK